MQILDKRNAIIEKGNLFFQNLKPSDDIYIIGTNAYGLSMASFIAELGISIKGFINDFYKLELYDHYPVYKSHHDFTNGKIINCIVEGRTIEVENLIERLNPKDRCDYFAMQIALKDQLPEINYLYNTDSILENINEYDWLYNLVADQESKNELEAIVNFRLTRDIAFLNGFRFRINEQYFENFIDLKNVRNFVDGGSYDGATVLDYISRQPDYNKIYVFEPNEESYFNTFNRLHGLKGITFFKKGIWKSADTLYFNSNLGSASRIDNQGKLMIEVVSLDDVINEKIDFIKFDIEGAELNGIKGAVNIIRKSKPILAICVYHNQNDFIDIPRLICDLNPNYKVYLRHYTQGVLETVMYFLP